MSTYARIVPAVLPATKEELDLEFRTLALLPTEHKKIHIDVADGIFVPHTTYPFHHNDAFTEIDCLPQFSHNETRHMSVHCMVAHPERVVPMYIRAGASEVIIHIESFSDMALLEACVAMWNVHDVKVVLASLLHTPVETLVTCMERTHIDRVLLMSIAHPGKQGTPFDRFVLTHIHELLRLYPSARIAVDGGLNAETIDEVLAAGVEECVVGSHLLHAKDILQVYERLVAIAHTFERA